jgi:hypothetical protein
MTQLLSYIPVRDSYTMIPAYNTVETRLDGGKSRKRRDFLGGVHVITPTWILKGTEYTDFMGFFREGLYDGSISFVGTFLSDVGVTCFHQCTCMGGMPKLSSQSGDTFFVSATLEVTPNPARSFGVQFLNVGGQGRVKDLGNFITTGDMSEFPIGRNVLISQSRQTQGTWGGTFVDLQGVYQIQSKPAIDTIQLLSAATVNTDWTVLGTLTPATTTRGVGVCVLLPI